LPTSPPKIRLADAVSHTALGVNVSKSEPGTIPVVRASDLPDDIAYIMKMDFDRRALKPGGARDKAKLEDDDVIIVARGGQLRVGLASIHMGDDGAVIANNLMLIRTKPEILLGPVLAAWLGSPRGQHELNKISRSGTTMMSLRIQDVLELEVPVPPMEVQEHISKILFESAHAYEASIASAELRERLVREHCTELLTGVRT
jgi:hypothetical protein